MKVKATGMYEKLHLKDKMLDRIPLEGEEFIISKERYKELTETNNFNAVFVEKIEDEENIETATKTVKTETATKKRKKKTNDVQG